MTIFYFSDEFCNRYRQDNTSMTGNMTGGTVTGGNMTVSISSFDESESDGGTVSDDSEGGCIEC
jgi:hypothetical protein